MENATIHRSEEPSEGAVKVTEIKKGRNENTTDVAGKVAYL